MPPALTSPRLRSVHTSRFNSPLLWRSSCPAPFAHIATYARVSSDEQRDRHTVLNQRAALSRRLGSEPDVVVFRHYEDDGVSGTIPFEDRPAGRALARDARVGRFSQVWVVRADRLGRDAFELLRIWRVFESIGISLRATDENIDDPFYFDIHAVIAANERRKFLERSAEGMNRAAKEGRYTGGIVPLGYCVSGDRGFRRLVPGRLSHVGTTSPPPTSSGASITTWPSTAGLVRVSLPSSTRSASLPPIAAMVAAFEAVAPRASGAPGISATSSSIPSTGDVLQYGRRSSRSPTVVR